VACELKGSPRADCIYVDAMLGWLARMLRILFGARVVYSPGASDSELAATDCLVVTRDEELFRVRRGPTLLLRTDDHDAWIAAFLRLGFRPFERTACPACGGELVEVDCGEAERAVGHAVVSERCWRCTSCGHYYWVGSHWRGLRELVERARRADVDIVCRGP
jgi:uncharacterized protein with PIN domain